MNDEQNSSVNEDVKETQAVESTEPVVPKPKMDIPKFKDSIDQIFLGDVPCNAEQNERLKISLIAPIVFRIKDSGQTYTIDWTGAKIKVTAEIHPQPACTISLKKEHILAISKGDLNPQVAMLSDKIEIDGQMGLAVYVFNLIDAQSSFL